MKPLNRPMFRYGGPIKEGVMDGIREPKKNGGLSKQFNTGLVGDERYPKTDGRSHHVAFLAPAAFAALRFAARPFGQFVAKQIAKKGVTGSGNIIRSGLGRSRTMLPGESLTTTKQVFNPNALGSYFAKSPEAGLVKGLISGSGRIAGPLKKVAVGGAKSPLTVGGLLYMGGSYFYPDGTPAAEEDIKKAVANAGRVGTSGAPGGGDPGMFLTPQAKGGEGATLSKEELRKRRVDRYRDIMDIKGMNKAAAYDSLIAASKAIGESGDFKGDLKSGRLINQIIQSTSKAFDKPKQTKDAIDTLILKGEIEKDIKASDPAAQQKARLTEKQIALADKSLAGDSFSEIISERYKKGKVPRGNELAGILRATEKVDVTTIDSTNIPQGVDAQTFFESQVNEAKTAGTPVAPGYYVISDRVLIVDEQGNVTPFL